MVICLSCNKNESNDNLGRCVDCYIERLGLPRPTCIDNPELREKVYKLTTKLDKIKQLGFHNMAVPQTSTSVASFLSKQRKLQQLLEDEI